MTQDPTQEPEEKIKSDKVTLKDKRNVSLFLLAVAYAIPFLWPFAIAATIGMFPRTSKKIGFVLLGLIVVGIMALVINTAEKSSEPPSDITVEGTTQGLPNPAVKSPKSEPSSSRSKTSSRRRYLGTSPTGYELWADNDCIYVKGITEGDLRRLGTNIRGFKKAVKLETGYSCVIYE